MRVPHRRLFLVATSLFSVAAWANDTPVAVADEADHHGGTVLVVDVLANDSDADGEALEIYGLSGCSGTLAVEFGVVTLTPDQGAPEACTITYSIRDEDGNSSTATVTVNNSARLLFRDDCELGDDSRWDGNVQ